MILGTQTKIGDKISKNDRDFEIFAREFVIVIKCPSFGQMSIFLGLVCFLTFILNSLEIKTCLNIYFGPSNPVHAGLLLSKTCTERAQGCMGQNTILNIFLFLKYFFRIVKPILVQI